MHLCPATAGAQGCPGSPVLINQLLLCQAGRVAAGSGLGLSEAVVLLLVFLDGTALAHVLNMLAQLKHFKTYRKGFGVAQEPGRNGVHLHSSATVVVM